MEVLTMVQEVIDEYASEEFILDPCDAWRNAWVPKMDMFVDGALFEFFKEALKIVKYRLFIIASWGHDSLPRIESR